MNQYVVDMDRYATLARQTVAEGIVLLENHHQTLPIKQNEKVSIFGRIQFDYYKCGTGSGGLVNTSYVIGILDALKEENLQLNEELMHTYEAWIDDHLYDFGQGWAKEPWCQEEMPLTDDIIRQAKSFSDAAIVIIGRTAGEDKDASAEKGSYLLSDLEEDMLRQVCGNFSRVIVLLNVGNTIDMKWVAKYKPSAVLYVWQGGMEGGHGVADVLVGRVNPCGKLSDTIANDIADYPSTAFFGGESGNCYAEDIYVGYRYFETFAKEKVCYPFGYGLSYTKFDIETLSVNREIFDGAGKVTLKVAVTNTGDRMGKEVVQVYLQAPQGQLGKPLRSLVAFAKTKELLSGEREEITFTISDQEMASYDDSGKSGYAYAYVMEAGIYGLYVGNDVRSCTLAGTFNLQTTTLIEQLTQAAAPAQRFQRMYPSESQDENKNLILTWENVPLRKQSVKEHIENAEAEVAVYLGDKGWKLEDVYDGKVSMKEFLSQISDYELCCMLNGEGMCSSKVTPGTASAFGGVTEELAHFGIPCGCCTDGPSGIRMDCGAEAFGLPGGTCMACTFNEKLIEDLFVMEGAELRKNRIDTLLGPGMNIHRNPLNGRNFEYFSEDPFLTGKVASAQLRGMSQYEVTGTVKHFVANNQEYRRHSYNSVISERALREIYLKGFEIAVKEGKAYSVMTTYGGVNGIWTAGNYDLLTIILRNEWGFDGMVMTDWWANINEEGTVPSQTQMTAMVNAQNDVYMVTNDTTRHLGDLEESLAKGRLKRGTLVRSAENICKMLMRSPVMDRFLGRVSKEEQQAQEQNLANGGFDFDMPWIKLEDTLELPTENLNTSRGSEIMYGMEIKEPAFFELHMKVKVDASEIAQVPVSAFVNGTLTTSITMNGTNGQYRDICLNLGNFRFERNYLRLYFAQGGMQIQSMKVKRKQ